VTRRLEPVPSPPQAHAATIPCPAFRFHPAANAATPRWISGNRPPAAPFRPLPHCAPRVTWQATPGSTHRFRRGIMLSIGPNRMRSPLEKLRSSGWRHSPPWYRRIPTEDEVVGVVLVVVGTVSP